MEASPSSAPGLKRSLSVWAAVGLSVALMAPSMAANINPQGSALHAGRAVPLTFLIAAVGVLLVAYSFVRLCQYFHHSGSVYAFVGATLGPRTGVVAGWGLLGTYTFYAVVTSAAAGIFGTAFLDEEAHRPTRDIPRAILGTAIFGGLYFVIVTAVEVMGFGAGPAGVKAFTNSQSLLGDLGSTYVGSWVGDVITLGTAISAFGCCLACVVGAARLVYALSRDTAGPRGLGQSNSRWGTPVWATLAVVVSAGVIVIVESAVAAHADAFNSFLWSGTIGTLILLVVYVLASVGCIMLVFVRHKLPVPMWQIIVPA